MLDLLFPYALIALPLPVLVYFAVPRSERSEAALWVPFYEAAAAYDASGNFAKSNWLQRWLLVLCWLALVLAAAQPVWVGEPISLPTSGRDLMLAVDVSGSMDTEDMILSGRQVTRLAAVKSVVGDFVERRHGDRIGLLLFGEKPYLQAPLTFDRATVNQLLMEAEINVAGPRTAIGYAIGLGVKLLQDRPAENRVLVLLTDGVNNVGDVSPLQAARLARQRAIRIHAIGMGATELTLNRLFGRRTVNPSADLDEESLRAIAELTGGNYYRVKNLDDLVEVYRDLDLQEPTEQAPETFRPQRSLFRWPLGFAFIVGLCMTLANGLAAGVAGKDGLTSARRALRPRTEP